MLRHRSFVREVLLNFRQVAKSGIALTYRSLTMSKLFSGKYYKPGISTTRNSQELWQICFDDEDLHGDLGDGERISLGFRSTAESGSGDGMRSNGLDRRNMKYEDTDEVELTNDSTNDRKSKLKSNKQAYHLSLRPFETEIRAIPTGSSGNGCAYSTTTVNNDTFSTRAKTDEATPIRSGQTRIHIRRDSDLELLLPPQPDRVGALRKKARECCSDCARWPTWRKVLCVALVVIAGILLYVVIMVAIVKGIGG